jgi:hypothetical protein
MVSVMALEILASKRNCLIKLIQDTFDQSTSHSKAFAHRILGPDYNDELGKYLDTESPSEESDYGGYPELATIGYMLGGENLVRSYDSDRFLAGISRLKERSHRGLGALLVDDVAILGLVDGLRKIKSINPNQDIEETQEWLMRIINQRPLMQIWSSRLRDLAGDLIDNRGRLRTLPLHKDVNTGAIEVTLRYTWPEQFLQVSVPSWDEYKVLLRELLSQSVDTGDLEKSAVWLKAMDLLVDQSCAELFPITDKEKVAVAEMTKIKTNLDRKAEKQAKFTVWLYAGLVLAVIILLAALNYRFTWDVMEPWTYFIGASVALLSIIYFAFTAREFSLTTFYGQILKTKKRKIYRKFDFNINRYEELT